MTSANRAQRRATAKAPKPNGGPTGPRERVVPKEGAKRINEAWAASARAKQRAYDITDAVLAGMGLDLPEPGSAVTWNVSDGAEPGSLIARYGPRVGDVPAGLQEAITAAVVAGQAETPKDEAPAVDPKAKPN